MSRYFTKTLASLEPYTPGEQLKIADIVKLNANENPYPPAPGVAAAVAAAVPGLRLYSDLTNGDHMLCDTENGFADIVSLMLFQILIS